MDHTTFNLHARKWGKGGRRDAWVLPFPLTPGLRMLRYKNKEMPSDLNRVLHLLGKLTSSRVMTTT